MQFLWQVTTQSSACDSFWISSILSNSTSFSYEGTVRSRTMPNQSLINPIWLIWHHATSDRSFIWKGRWRAAILRGLKRFKRNCKQHSRLSQELHSEKFSSNRKRGGSGALQCRRTTSRVAVILSLTFFKTKSYDKLKNDENSKSF